MARLFWKFEREFGGGYFCGIKSICLGKRIDSIGMRLFCRVENQLNVCEAQLFFYFCQSLHELSE